MEKYDRGFVEQCCRHIVEVYGWWRVAVMKGEHNSFEEELCSPVLEKRSIGVLPIGIGRAGIK